MTRKMIFQTLIKFTQCTVWSFFKLVPAYDQKVEYMHLFEFHFFPLVWSFEFLDVQLQRVSRQARQVVI